MSATPIEPEPEVEVFVKITSVVQDLSAAWGFVMDHLERVGPDPVIVISPMWRYGTGGQPGPRLFETTVSGTVTWPHGRPEN